MQFLLIVFVVCVLLFVLYLLARRVRSIGLGLAFVCLVASRVFIRISDFANQAALYCHKACLATLSYPPGSGTGEYWPVVRVLARLVYFVLAVLLLAGETFSTLVAVPALFHTQLHLQLPDIVELATASLFVTTSALEGACLFELLGLIPREAGLFPAMGKLLRIGFVLLTALALALSILLLGYFYLFRGAYILDPDSAQQMGLYILAALGVSVAYSAILALWALVIGSCGVASVVLWTSEQVCQVVSAAASIVPSLLNVLAVHLSQGHLSVYGEYEGHDVYKVPSPLFGAPVGTSYLPEIASGVDTNIVEADPVENSLEEIVKNPEKNASLVFVGSNFGTGMFVPVVQKIASFHAVGTVLSSCYLDLEGSPSNQKSIKGVHDLSPTPALVRNALSRGNGEHNPYSVLLSDLSIRFVEKHLPRQTIPGTFLYCVDAPLLGSMSGLLRENKSRLPLICQVVITSLPCGQALNSNVQEGLANLVGLHAEGSVDLMLIMNLLSPFALLNTKDFQHRFLANSLASLLVGHLHSSDNQSFTNLVRELRASSLFVGVNFASQAIATVSVPSPWSFLPWVKWDNGSGDYQDMIIQSRKAIDQVLSGGDTRSYPSDINANQPAKVVVAVPYALNDERFPRIVRDTKLYVASHYPFASSITVSGNGTTLPYHTGGRFVVQAAAFYPLPNPLDTVTQEKKQADNVTPLYQLTPVVEASNGHGLLNGTQAADVGDREDTKRETTPPRATRRKISSK